MRRRSKYFTGGVRVRPLPHLNWHQGGCIDCEARNVGCVEYSFNDFHGEMFKHDLPHCNGGAVWSDSKW